MEENFRKIFKDLIEKEHFEAFEDYFDEIVEDNIVIEDHKNKIVERFLYLYAGQWESGAEYAEYILKRKYRKSSMSLEVDMQMCYLLMLCDYEHVWNDFLDAGVIQTENGYIFDHIHNYHR